MYLELLEDTHWVSHAILAKPVITPPIVAFADDTLGTGALPILGTCRAVQMTQRCSLTEIYSTIYLGTSSFIHL